MELSAAEKKYVKMVETPIRKLVCIMAIPTVISMLMTSFYNMVDTYFVGGLGTSATGAIGVANSVMIVIQAMGYFFGNGAGNYISRALGRHETKNASRAASTGLILCFSIGIILAALGIVLLEPLVYFLGSTKTIAPYAKDYLLIILCGMPFTSTSFYLNCLLRYQGNANYGMVGIVIGGVLNVILDPIFITVLHMDVAGAALATVISQFISFVILFVQNIRAGVVSLSFKDFTPKLKFIIAVIKDGLPTLYRQVLISVSVVLLNTVAKPYGDAAIAAMSVVSKITTLATCFLFGIGQGFQPVCGFNYGAKRYDRVLSAFWFYIWLTVALLAVIGIIGFLFAPDLIRVFRDDTEVVKIGAKALRYMMAILPLTAANVIITMMTQTTGYLLQSTILALSRQGICYVPCVLLLPHFFGITGLELVNVAAELLSLVIAIPIGIYIVRKFEVLRREQKTA